MSDQVNTVPGCAICPAKRESATINPLGCLNMFINPLMPLAIFYDKHFSPNNNNIMIQYNTIYPLPILHFITTVVSYSGHPGMFFNVQCC